MGDRPAGAANTGCIVDRFGKSIAAAHLNSALKAPAHSNRSGMSGGIGFRGFPIKRLDARNTQTRCRPIRRFDDIQVRSFRAGVIEIQREVCRTKFALHIQVPDLYVPNPVVAVHSEIVRYCFRRQSWKPILQSQRLEARINIGLRNRERRLERQLLRQAAVSAGVVIDAVARAQDRAVCNSPGNADARREIVSIGLDEAHRKNPRK